MVKVGFLADEPIILAAVAAMVSRTPFERGSIEDLYNMAKTSKKESIELVNKIMKQMGHMIFGDFLPYAVTIEDLSRFAALYFWRNVNVQNLIFGAGIEASFRVLKPNKFNEVISDFGKEAFDCYQKIINLGVPEQDARYILPAGMLTRIIFSAPPRYLAKIANILKNTPLEELRELGQKISELISKKFNLNIPEEFVPSRWQIWGGKTIKLEMRVNYRKMTDLPFLNGGISGSLSMYAQLVRQRLILCDIEPLEGIARQNGFIIPPTFPQEAVEIYKNIAEKAKKRQVDLIEKKDPNFVYFLLLGQEARAKIYGFGSALIESSKTRSCGTAQWEIRNIFGIPLTFKLARYTKLKTEIGPRCWREKRCIEPSTFKTKTQVCQAFLKYKGNWREDLEDLLNILQQPYEILRF